MSATFLTIKNNKNRGTSLVEMVLYIVLLTLVTGIIIQMLVAVGGVYRNIKLTRELESSGTIAMERMLREIRNASGVDVGSSSIGTSPGVLAISGVDESSNSYNIKFNISSGVLQISKNSETPVALTSSPTTISYLLFNHITNTNSEGVRIELEVFGTVGSVSKTEKFYGFAVLRGSY